jgi:hypothetical protein
VSLLDQDLSQLSKATELVSKLWFPYDRALLSSIQKKLEENDFYEIKDEIVLDLEKDLSLFLLSLKELVILIESDPFESKSTSRDFFSQVGKEELQTALKKVSTYRFNQKLDSASVLQKQKLVEMYVSGITVKKISQALMETQEIPLSTELNYSCVLLRQLGATLITWNYPEIYEKVAMSCHTQNSFDESFRSSLGFSPMMLGFSIAQSWNLPHIYLDVLGGEEYFRVFNISSQLGEHEKKLSSSIVQICEIGEALARSMNPELYSTSVADLDKASKYIQKVIGEEGVKEILTSLKTQLKDLKLDSLEHVINDSTNILKEKISEARYASEFTSKNIYLDSVPENIKSLIQELYSQMTPDGLVQNYASFFAKKIIPETAFSSLIVYLNDPFQNALFPSLIIGAPRAIAPKAVSLSGNSSSYNLVSAGFGLKTPLREDRVLNENEEVLMFASALGVDPVIGVLYAEIDHLSGEIPVNTVRYFKAIKKLLSDCLRLETYE